MSRESLEQYRQALREGQRFAKAAESAGVQYMMVEQDDCNGEDPFACLKRSYEYLKSAGF